MIAKLVASVALAVCVCGLTATAQEEKKATGNVVGTVKALHNTKDGKNSMLEVLAPGEEKARMYHVMYDPKIKGPLPNVLAAVRASKTGDMVEINWIATGHGPAIQSFKVLKKAPSDK